MMAPWKQRSALVDKFFTFLQFSMFRALIFFGKGRWDTNQPFLQNLALESSIYMILFMTSAEQN